MKKVVEYEVFCFLRTLRVVFASEVDEHKVLDVIDDAYDDWHGFDVCETCEDYIIARLEDEGYEIESWDSIDYYEQAK